MKRKYPRDRSLGFTRIHPSHLSLRMLTLWFVLLGFSIFVIEPTDAGQSISSFKEEVKEAIKALRACLLDPVSEKNIGDMETGMDKIVSDAEKQGKPVCFGIGILDKNGVAVAGRYVIGIFKEEDFSRYKFVKKAFKKKKIVQDRLYFQDHSELWIICAPLVQQKKVIGAIVLGFDPTQVKKDYGLSKEQFLALDLNK